MRRRFGVDILFKVRSIKPDAKPMISVSRFAAAAGFAWMSAAVSAQAGTCKVDKAAELPLSSYSGTLAVPAKINDTIVNMGVDSGAQTLVTPETSNFGFEADIGGLDISGSGSSLIGVVPGHGLPPS
jgi:hypothetical protein